MANKDTTTIYHNKRCSKSRETMALLEEHGVEPTVVYYLETPPSAKDLMQILAKLGKPATDIIRFKEKLAKELAISASDERTDQQWCDLLTANPSLIERPIVVRGDQAAIGRPAQNVLALIN